MKYLLLFFVFFLTSCTSNQNKQLHIVKFGTKGVSNAEFINTLMILGFTKYGKPFYSKIYDPVFFEQMKIQTLEHIINNMFFNSLSQKYKIKITEPELTAWMKQRTPDLKKEDLIYTLKANNFSYSDWKNLFRKQFIQNRITEQINGTISPKTTKTKKSTDDALYLAIISFEEQFEAQEKYKKITKNRLKFDVALKAKNQTSLYSWVKNKDLPFYKKIKFLPLKKTSKPIETPWGYSLIKIKKRGKFPLPKIHAAKSQNPSAIKPLLEEFKKNPKLHINTDLLYSLKIKK